MKKLISLSVFFFLSIIATHAQTWQWTKSCASNTNGIGDGTSVSTDAAGSVFIAGSYFGTMTVGSNTLSAGVGTKAYLIKYDASGNPLWAKTPTSTALSPYNFGMYVCSDASGNSLMTGYFQDPTITFGTYTLTNTGKQNMFLVKYDPNGNVLWAKNPIDTAIDYAFSVSCDANNNVYVSGTFSNTTIVFGTNTLTSNNINSLFLVKYDANGNVQWARKNASGEVADYFYHFYGVSVSAEANGNAFVTGSFKTPPVVIGTNTLMIAGANIFLAKYDGNGNELWAKSAIGKKFDGAYSVNSDGMGNAYITGYYNSSPLVFGTNTITGTGNNFFLAKYDANGDALWIKNSVGIGSGCSVSSYSGGVFVVGKMNSGTPITLGSYTLNAPVASIAPAFIAQYDVNGNVLYADFFTSGGDDWIAVSTDKFCNAYITGDFAESSFVVGTETLTQTGLETTFTAKLSFTNCESVNAVKILSNVNSEIKIYPNPSSGFFSLQIEESIKNLVFSIENALGQEIHKQTVSKGENQINIKNIASGLYYYSVRQNNQMVKTGKILVE